MPPAWSMLALVLLGLLTAQGVRIAFGAFVPAWRDGLHAGLGSLSQVSYLVYGCTQPLVGRLAGRFGPRAVLSGGVFVAGAGLLAAATASTVPGLAFLWRTPLVAEGALLVVAVGPLIALALRSRPEDSGHEPYGGPDTPEAAPTQQATARGELGALLRSPLLWALLGPFFVCGVTTTGLMDTYMVSMCRDMGVSTGLTGTAVGAMAAANVAGTVLSGRLGDRYDCARLLAVLYGTRAVTLALMALMPTGVPLLALSAAFGLVDFATVAPTHLIAARHFPGACLGLVFGLLSMAHQVGSALGSYLPGVLHDATGSYTPALLGCAVALLAAAPVCLAARPDEASRSSRGVRPLPADRWKSGRIGVGVSGTCVGGRTRHNVRKAHHGCVHQLR
ncbi:MFS transporter [Streptomyces sp. RS10V-4]|uniref:MFS transporter n=1 Tax=Streptomyces rhizoryzae TaxID=2932493 RepID=UPI0020040292|nr:MFS transporter [Streptomyces rhizoryzae]MCK7622822.1 MFS transporter [Streptomyces rhizoryzae]